MKNIVIVPARCGSKGFPNKNIAKLEGRTLIEIAVNVGVKCSLVDKVYISTDSALYEDIAIKSGATSMGLRSEELSSDTTKTIDVVLSLVASLDYEPENIVLLQPTSPIRTAEQVHEALSFLIDKDANAVVSVSRLDEPHPNKLKKISKDGYIESYVDKASSEVPRQLLPELYKLNGAIYVINTKILRKEKTFFPDKTIPFIMEEGVNIDSERDYLLAKVLLENRCLKLG